MRFGCGLGQASCLGTQNKQIFMNNADIMEAYITVLLPILTLDIIRIIYDSLL